MCVCVRGYVCDGCQTALLRGAQPINQKRSHSDVQYFRETLNVCDLVITKAKQTPLTIHSLILTLSLSLSFSNYLAFSPTLSLTAPVRFSASLHLPPPLLSRAYDSWL